MRCELREICEQRVVGVEMRSVVEAGGVAIAFQVASVLSILGSPTVIAAHFTFLDMPWLVIDRSTLKTKAAITAHTVKVNVSRFTVDCSTIKTLK